MANKAVNIESYDFQASDQLLFDTNIWIYILVPQSPKNRYAKIYSDKLNQIITAQSSIYIDALILSEFINRSSRLSFNSFPSNQFKDFKEFRNSSYFKPFAVNIAADIRRILSFSSRIESGFNELAVDDLIDEYQKGDSDFNDQILTAICKRRGLKLVTNDSDFNSKEILILTANSKLLK